MSTTSLSRRAKFDLATLLTAGGASSAFFLLPVWTNPHRPAAQPVATVSAIARADVVKPAPAAQPRAAVRAARAPRAAAFHRVKTEAKPQSRLSRLLLGDGSAPVQPFPVRER
jgi:hypothetical protein